MRASSDTVYVCLGPVAGYPLDMLGALVATDWQYSVHDIALRRWLAMPSNANPITSLCPFDKTQELRPLLAKRRAACKLA